MRQSKCLTTYTNSFLSLMNSSIAETLEKHWFVVTKNKDPTLEGKTEQWKSEGTTRSNTVSLRHHHTIKSVLFSVHRMEIFNCATVNLSCILYLPFYIPFVLMCKPGRTVAPLGPLAIPCCSALRLVNPTLLGSKWIPRPSFPVPQTWLLQIEKWAKLWLFILPILNATSVQFYTKKDSTHNQG